MLSLHTCGHPKRRATPCLVHCRLLFGSGSRRHGRRYVHVPRMNTVLVYARRCDWRARNLAYTMLNRFTVRASWTKRRGRAVTSRLIEVAVRYRKASSAMMGALAREQTGAARRTREAARASDGWACTSARAEKAPRALSTSNPRQRRGGVGVKFSAQPVAAAAAARQRGVRKASLRKRPNEPRRARLTGPHLLRRTRRSCCI